MYSIKDRIEDLKPAGFYIMGYPRQDDSNIYVFKIAPKSDIFLKIGISDILKQFWFDIHIIFGDDSITLTEHNDGAGNIVSVDCVIDLNGYKLHKRKYRIDKILKDGGLG